MKQFPLLATLTYSNCPDSSLLDKMGHFCSLMMPLEYSRVSNRIQLWWTQRKGNFFLFLFQAVVVNKLFLSVFSRFLISIFILGIVLQRHYICCWIVWIVIWMHFKSHCIFIWHCVRIKQLWNHVPWILWNS